MKTASTELPLSRASSLPLVAPPRRVPPPLAVVFAGKLTALTESGGAEALMHSLIRALPSIGVQARPGRPWEEPLVGADCLHLFGSTPEYIPVVEAARRQRVKVVLSPLAWLDGCGRHQPHRPLAQRVSEWAGFVGRSVCPRLRSWRRQLYQLVDLLVPNSNAEAQQMMRHFQAPAQQIQIVPFGAEPRFAQADPEPFARLFGLRQFVLYAGPIEPCNNQLCFLWATRDTDLPVVMLGEATPGCEWYMDECRRVANHRVRFLPPLDHDDPLLASAYASCGCMVLPSGTSNAGLAALEAGMSGTPLVLVEGGCAAEYLGRQAVYARPDDAPGIRRAVLTALARGRSSSLAQHVRTWFSTSAAAKAMREAYRKVLRENAGSSEG